MRKTKLKPKTIKEKAKKNLRDGLLFHLPSALVIMFYSKTWLYSFTISIISKSKSLYQFLHDWQIFFHLPLILIAIIFPLWSKYKAETRIVYSNTEELRAKIADAINKVVNLKLNRFRAMYMRLKSERMSDGKIFRATTQPSEQIELLSANLLLIIKYASKSQDLKLTTIVCRNNQMDRFIYHSNFPPKITVKDLEQNNSAAKKCIIT